jgi:hypothetical protein
LEDGTGRKKMVINQFEDLALIYGGGPKHLGMCGGHGDGKRKLVQFESKEKEDFDS